MSVDVHTPIPHVIPSGLRSCLSCSASRSTTTRSPAQDVFTSSTAALMILPPQSRRVQFSDTVSKFSYSSSIETLLNPHGLIDIPPAVSCLGRGVSNICKGYYSRFHLRTEEIPLRLFLINHSSMLRSKSQKTANAEEGAAQHRVYTETTKTTTVPSSSLNATPAESFMHGPAVHVYSPKNPRPSISSTGTSVPPSYTGIPTMLKQTVHQPLASCATKPVPIVSFVPNSKPSAVDIFLESNNAVQSRQVGASSKHSHMESCSKHPPLMTSNIVQPCHSTVETCIPTTCAAKRQTLSTFKQLPQLTAPLAALVCIIE